MADSFDPYLKWLGIRKQNGPIDYYRLLGLEIFESDLDVISNAAERQIRHVESFATGEYADTSKRMVAELRVARDCLLNQDQRAVYDPRAHSGISVPTLNQVEAKPTLPEIDVGNSNVDPPNSQPKIRTTPSRRRKKKSAAFDIAGWVLGAIGAVAFAYVLLNTDLVDRIKGRGPVAENETIDEIAAPLSQPSNHSSTKKRPTTSSTNPPSNVSSINKPKTESPEATGKLETRVMRSQPKSSLPSSNRSNSNAKPISKVPVTRSPKKLPVPDREKLAIAGTGFSANYRTQLKGHDLTAKRLLAKTLVNNSANATAPEKRFVELKNAATLAGETGSIETLLSAVEALNDNFQISFWEHAKRPSLDALSGQFDFEMLATGFAELAARCQDDEEFVLCAEFAGKAADIARKQGDFLQQMMLSGFAKDMKALGKLKKKYETFETRDAKKTRSPKDKLTIGKYLCFGKGDWIQGLQMLAQCSDQALAAVAKADLDSADLGNDQIAVAQSWFNLSKKNKYNGLDRRFLLNRARQKIEDAGKKESKTRQLAHAIRQQTQFVKQFVDDPQTIRQHTFVFDISGPTTFDSARLEHGQMLILGLGQRSQTLLARQTPQALVASTRDGKISFQIRLMNNGIVEMRLYDSASGTLQNIMYGK